MGVCGLGIRAQEMVSVGELSVDKGKLVDRCCHTQACHVG